MKLNYGSIIMFNSSPILETLFRVEKQVLKFNPAFLKFKSCLMMVLNKGHLLKISIVVTPKIKVLES